MNPDNEDSIPQNFPVVAGLEMLELLAQGAHGSVYCARQVEHDRLVALKVLDTRFVDNTTRRRFDRERVALGRISHHPSIVPLIDSGYTEAGLPYLILEYAPGGSLAEYIADVGPMNLDDVTKMGINLAAAVECSHGAGIIHRDIKPGNILLSAYGDWMLTDFGIASLVDSPNTSTMQVSYAHTAPEIFEGGVPHVAADVYSLASVLATALSGSEPFEVQPDESPVSAMRRIVSEPYPDLRKAKVPDDLATLLEAALSKEPTNRPMNARSFAAALNEIRVRHGLAKLPVRMIQEPGTGATEVVDEDHMVQLASESEKASTMMAASSPAGEKSLMPRIAVAFALVAALFGVSIFGLATVEGAAPDAIAAQVFDDDDGPGNRNGDGDGDGRGGFDGVAQDADDNAPDDNAADDNAADDNGDDDADADDANNDGDDDADDDADDDGDNDGDGNDGPGNGDGNGGNNNGPGNGNGGGGPGNGGGGNNNGPGNGNGGNGPGNGGGGNGPGNGGGGNGPGNGGGN